MRKLFTRLFPISGLLSVGLVLALAGPLAAAVTITTPATATLTTGTQQYPLSATGGTGVYTWSVASGTLPTGLALRTDVPSFFNPIAQQAGLIGVATTPGTYNFTVSLTTGADTASLAMTVKITAFNITNGGGLPDAFLGNAYSYTFASINAAGAVTYSVAPGSSLPTGLTLSPGGVLSGTPTVPGNANFAVSANDGTDTVTTGVNVTVSAINITTPAILPNGTQNSSYTQALTATGGTGAITWSVHGGLPHGLSIVGSSLTGTINQGPGTYYYTLNASDTVSNFASKQISITVLGTPPQLLGISPNPNLDSATVGDRYNAGFTVCCGGVGPFTWSASGLPAGMSFRFATGTTSPFIAAGALELFGIPQAVGNFTINLTATGADGQSATLPVSFRVSALNVNSPGAGTLGVAYNQALRVLGGTAPYSATLTSDSQPLPLGVSLTPTPPTLTGTPAENGSFNPTLTISDSGSNTLTRHLPIFISNVAGSTGVFINDGYDLGYTPRNTPFSRTLSASGTGPFTWSVASGSLPSGLTLHLGHDQWHPLRRRHLHFPDSGHRQHRKDRLPAVPPRRHRPHDHYF